MTRVFEGNYVALPVPYSFSVLMDTVVVINLLSNNCFFLLDVFLTDKCQLDSITLSKFKLNLMKVMPYVNIYNAVRYVFT